MSIEKRIIIETGLEARVAVIAEPVIEDLGYQLVRVNISGKNGMTVQIMAERPDGKMGVDDCVAISHALSPELDVHDPITEAYDLEVSTAGIDRPLVRRSDFERWAGQDTKIETEATINGQRRFRGTLLGVREEEGVAQVGLRPNIIRSKKSLAEPDPDFWLDLENLSSAELVMSDELIETAQKMFAATGIGQDLGTDDVN